MQVHLVDGTYELFRHYYALPPHRNRAGREVAATRGVLGSLFGLLDGGATHVGVATDHVIESFRNDLFEGYKRGDGIDPPLREQFEPLEDALRAAGFTVFAMVEYEADDALAAAAHMAARDARVERVLICTPDKDLAQCVDDGRVVQLDRRADRVLDDAAVREKFGVPPASIPDYLALVGDSADGFPGIPGWGAKSTARVLARFGHVESIPDEPDAWDVPVRGAARLAAELADRRDEALLYKHLATLVVEGPEVGTVDDLEWRGPTDDFRAVCDDLDAPALAERARRLARARPS